MYGVDYARSLIEGIFCFEFTTLRFVLITLTVIIRSSNDENSNNNKE